MPRQIQRFGWKRDIPDERDFKFVVPRATTVLPRSTTKMIALMPPVWNQGNLGSCTGHGTSAAFAYDRAKNGQKPAFIPSRLMCYYNGRLEEGTQNSDSGASVRDAIKGTVDWGLCDESLWPYDIAKYATTPSPTAIYAASVHRTTVYERLSQDIVSMKSCIAAGFPFVFGFTVYQSFDTAAHGGLMPMPAGSVLGAHCVCACGYNSRNYILCRNSWGTGWGDPDFPGYFWMNPNYITNSQLCADFWVIQTVGG